MTLSDLKQLAQAGIAGTLVDLNDLLDELLPERVLAMIRAIEVADAMRFWFVDHAEDLPWPDYDTARAELEALL